MLGNIAFLTVAAALLGVCAVQARGGDGSEGRGSIGGGRGAAVEGRGLTEDVSSAVRQRSSVDDISHDKVRSAVFAFLSERFPAQAPRLEVRVVRIGGSAAESESLDIRIPRADAVPRGHTQVRLIQTGEDVGWALLYVAHFDSIAVLQTDVAKDAALDRNDVGFAWMDVTRFRGEPLPRSRYEALASDGQLYATKPLRSGNALRVEDLRPPWAADTGSSVMMTYHRGPIVFRMSCQAREPGAVGDVIRVYNADTKTTYKARLTGAGKAEWKSTL